MQELEQEARLALARFRASNIHITLVLILCQYGIDKFGGACNIFGMTGKEAIKIIQRLGVSQRQFAFMIGVHPNSVSKWATGGELNGPTVTLMRLLDERPELIKELEDWRK